MSLRTLIETSWQKPNLLSYALWPVSQLYRALFAIRAVLYRARLIKSFRAPVPVVVVGNLTVGGTGKTPLVIFLVEELRRQGYHPGVISRGYGSRAPEYPYAVTADSPIQHSGDEPALIVRRTQVPMVIGADRQQSVEKLIAEHQVDIIVSDDGLQHLALQRDLEICLIDASSNRQNQCLLPAGPYREPLARLQSVDLVVANGSSNTALLKGVVAHNMRLQPDAPRSVSEPRSDGQFNPDGILHAVAGIGNPQRFFDTCSQLGYQFEEHEFADHHQFTFQDIDFGSKLVLMTEKDAVKCVDFADQRHWYLPVTAKLDDKFVTTLTEKLADLRTTKSTQSNGH